MNDYDRQHSGEYVLAFTNAGEDYFTAWNVDHLSEIVQERCEYGAGQCEACGSFDGDGNPGGGFVIELGRGEGTFAVARCLCCGDQRPVHWAHEDTVVF